MEEHSIDTILLGMIFTEPKKKKEKSFVPTGTVHMVLSVCISKYWYCWYMLVWMVSGSLHLYRCLFCIEMVQFQLYHSVLAVLNPWYAKSISTFSYNHVSCAFLCAHLIACIWFYVRHLNPAPGLLKFPGIITWNCYLESWLNLYWWIMQVIPHEILTIWSNCWNIVVAVIA